MTSTRGTVTSVVTRPTGGIVLTNDINLTSSVAVEREVTIDGAGFSLISDGSDRVLDVSDGDDVADSITVNLDNITITGGGGVGSGAGIRSEEMLNLTGVTVTGNEIDELDERGVEVMSAGIAAMPGGRPSVEAVNVMHERHLDLSSHLSQPLSPHLTRHADLILTMTRSHRDAVVAQSPDAESRVRLLRIDQQDVSDPFGGGTEVYRQCADQIDEQLEFQLQQLDLDTLIGEVSSG